MNIQIITLAKEKLTHHGWGFNNNEIGNQALFVNAKFIATYKPDTKTKYIYEQAVLSAYNMGMQYAQKEMRLAMGVKK